MEEKNPNNHHNWNGEKKDKHEQRNADTMGGKHRSRRNEQ